MFDGVQIIDFAGPYEVFGHAGFGVVTVSEDGKAVTTAMGLKTVPDHSFADVPEFDVLLVPGGNTYDASHDDEVLAFINSHMDAVDQVLSVCTGSYILAESGILNGLEATTFHRALPGFKSDYPKINVVDGVRWTDDGKVITSAGLSSGIDAALHLVSKIQGVNEARSVALHMEYDWQPEGGFVRTKLADRYIPRVDIDWPDSTKVRPTVSYGDEKVWYQQIRAVSDLSAEKIFDDIATAVNEYGGWQAQKQGDDEAYWVMSEEGKTVSMSMKLLSSEENTHEFALNMTVN